MTVRHRTSSADFTKTSAAGRRANAKRTAALLDALIASIQDGVMAETDDGRIIVANAAFRKMFALPHPERLVGHSAAHLREHVWKAFISDAQPYRRLTTRLRRNRTPQIGLEIALTDGRILHRDYVPVRCPDGTVAHLWHYRDITERKELEARLREAQRGLRDLSARAELERENERQALARTLHDELGQLFTSIRMELVSAIGQFRALRIPAARPIVDRLQAAAGQTDLGIGALRNLSIELRPAILDDLGLVPAIRWAAALFTQRTGIRCHVRAPASLALEPAAVIALYRILLEALTNVTRHAAAGAVSVTLTERRGATVLDIKDNGRGIGADQIASPRTLGLLGMRERAVAVGGEVQITGARGRGTRVVVTLPRKAVAPAGAATRRARASRAGRRSAARA